MKSLPVIAAAALIAAGSWAQAAEPTTLDDAALDRVTAGVTILAISYVPPGGNFVNTSFGGTGGLIQNTFAATSSLEQVTNSGVTTDYNALAATSFSSFASGRGSTGAWGGAAAGAWVRP